MAFDPHETKASKAARRMIPSLRMLAREAQAEAVKDQAASRCFGLHRWTWWEPLEGSELNWQTRRCLKCGRIQDRRR